MQRNARRVWNPKSKDIMILYIDFIIIIISLF